MSEKKEAVAARSKIPYDTTNIYLWIMGRYTSHKVSIHAGHTTFFLVLSFIPFLMLLLRIVTFIPSMTAEKVLSVIENIGSGIFKLVLDPIAHDLTRPVGGIFLFTVITLLWAGSKGLDALAQGLDSIYGTRGKRGYIVRRACSLLYLIGFIVTLIVAIVLLVFGQYLRELVEGGNELPLSGFFSRLFSLYIPTIIIFISFFVLLFRFCPYTPLETRAEKKERHKNNRHKPLRERTRRPKYRTWKKEIPGAILTTVLWFVFSRLFSIYVRYRMANPSYYGSMASIFLALLLLYFLNMFILVGALYNNYSYRTGESATRHIIRDIPGLVRWVIGQLPWKKNKTS